MVVRIWLPIESLLPQSTPRQIVTMNVLKKYVMMNGFTVTRLLGHCDQEDPWPNN